jgi:UDP-N-acetylglucosamine--N-acetylmuramyl-(pentapeptide) pyrophosphoryl-undecaprenol N-acetylglucosamine transferase
VSYKERPYKFIISGGGTGGHIFPAIAIANALKEKLPDAGILFVGARGRMEMEKVPAAGYPIEGLWISGLQRKASLKNLSFPFKVVSSLFKARNLIQGFKPDAVIGVGGYASGPTLQVATGKGIPSLIQEQNSYPGITNKLLAGKVSRICVAYDGMEKYFPAEKIIKTGNPVRREVIQIQGKKEEAAEYFGLYPDRKTVLVIGGSQGARSINRSIAYAMDNFIDKKYQVIWQTGKFFHQEAMDMVRQSGSTTVAVKEFIDRMDLAYALADVVVSRAGAIAISEICAVGIPPVFVPFPAAAEDHQTKNAQALVDREAAELIPDGEARLNVGEAVIALMKDEARKKRFSENLKKMAIPDAADRIADEIVTLVKR